MIKIVKVLVCKSSDKTVDVAMKFFSIVMIDG